METIKDDNTSHMYGITDACVWFFSNSGACGWPTVLSIMFNTCIQPDGLKWVEKSGLTFPKGPAVGDNVHWYKTKFDNVSNFRRSVPYLLKDASFFNQKNIPSVINDSKAAFSTKNSVYFISLSGSVKVCRLTETDIENNSKDVALPSGSNIGTVLDVVSYDKYDYLLTDTIIYRFDSSLDTTGGQFEAFYKASSSMNAFAIIDSAIIIATSDGGVRLSKITSSSPDAIFIKHEQKIYTSTATAESGNSDGSSAATTVSEPYDNGVPSGACKFVYVEGSSYYIGNESTSGYFQSGDTNFTPVYGEKEKHEKILSSAPNKNCMNNTFIDCKGKLLYKGIEYSLTGVNCIIESDGFIYFGTSNGISIYSSSQIDSKYGPSEVYATPKGISGKVEYLLDLYDVIFSIGDSKYRSFDAYDEDNKMRIFLFGTDYDADANSGETDIRETKLSLKDLLNVGNTSSSKYSQLLGKANSKDTTYAMIIIDGSPKCFHLYGNDNRNARSEELKKCDSAFDIGSS